MGTQDVKTVADHFRDCMDKGLTKVAFLSNYPGVEIPDYLRNQDFCVLNFSYGYRVPDLEIFDTHVCCTLSFQGSPYFVVVPFCSIFQIGSGTHVRDFIPHEVPVPLQEKQDSHLRLVSFNPDIAPAISKADLRLVVDNTRTDEEPKPPDTPKVA